MVGKAQKSHGARSELNCLFGLEKVVRWNPIRTSAIQSRSRPLYLRGRKWREAGEDCIKRGFIICTLQ
jgi:hypothetical protein